MKEPKLRTVNKAVPPYPMNQFPNDFILKFAENIVYMMATKSKMSIEGDEWEAVFADCVGATWKPSNVGLDDVVLKNCCWSAKTVFGNTNIGKQTQVRLISGRNSPTYSFGVDRITEADPNEIGKLVLSIWNERVSGIRQYYKFARTIVLVKSKDHKEYLIFETETIRYDADQYYFKWKDNGNLIGFSKSNNQHTFTWQPHGSQFTIVESIPQNRLHLMIKEPAKLSKEIVLSGLNFDKSWVCKVDDTQNNQIT